MFSGGESCGMCISVPAAPSVKSAILGLGWQESMLAHGATGSAAHPRMWI